MASQSTQISASVSKETEKLLDAYTRKRGIKKSFVIEQALRHHLLAADEIPEEFIVPPVLHVGGRKRRMTDSKIKAARRLLAGGTPPRDVAENLGVSVPTLYRWLPASARP
jgi:DNA invertase Pin-like site-specific DNA recombinase